MSCGQIALQRAGIKVKNYYAAEIDKHAITVAKNNWPEMHQMGNVNSWQDWDIDWSSIDLIIAGSPCQGFSFAGKQLAFDDPRSELFFTFIDILEHIRGLNFDVSFMLENVRMKEEFLKVITNQLGVEPIMIDSQIVSAQRRKRYYWTSWQNTQPKDRGIYLRDILQEISEELRNVPIKEKSKCLRVGGTKSPLSGRHEWDSPFNTKSDCPKISKRRYTPIECERLQTVPDDYTKHVSTTQRYKMLGNGWTVDVITHLFSQMKDNLTYMKRFANQPGNILEKKGGRHG